VDRGWRRGEPQDMVWRGNVSFAVLEVGPNGKISSVGLRHSGQQARQADREFKYLVDALRDGKVFQVHSYNKDARLRVTRVGP
jgi:hypothetical protein